MKLKNGWPWSSIQNTGYSVPQYIIDKGLDISNRTDWENFRRPREQTSIYPHTRVKEWRSFGTTTDPEIKELALGAYEYIKDEFPNCYLYRSELIYMVSNGKVSWHYDVRKSHYYNTKVMLVLDNENVDFYFAAWNRNVRYTIPLNENLFDYENSIRARMKIGSFYIFNHRIPHSTINTTNQSRLMIMLEISPLGIEITDQYSIYPTQPDEFEPLAPPIL